MVTLHGSAFSTYTWSARLALEEKGVEYTLVPPRLRAPEYAALHPFRKMPALEHDGVRVFEAMAVMRYVDEAFAGPALQPADAAGRARMTQWMSAYNDFVAPHAVRGVLIPRLVLASRGVVVDEGAVRAAAANAREALAVFEAALGESPWLAGDTVSLADLLLAPTIVTGALLAGEDRYTDGLPQIGAWLARLEARPAYARARPG
ncbi:MAG: glutathione S-transferase family protein [Pseudomonadota bacterium]|nr:glutathione S-transferase family protein [Pseudomonadota bacterium]